MTTTIYANYGVLAHERQALFTATSPADSVLSEAITVDLPDEYEPYETMYGNIALMLDGRPYLLDEALSSKDDQPALRWIDSGLRAHCVPLRIVER